MFKFHHVALSVSDTDRSVRFYSALGFNEVYRWVATDSSLTIVHLKLDDAFLELFSYAAYKESPPSTETLDTDLPVIGIKHFGLQVSSIKEAREALLGLGFDISIDISKGRTGIDYVFVKDPDGIFVEIVEDKRTFE